MITITKANLNDLESISILFNQYRIFYRQASDIDAARAFIKERIVNNESVIFIAYNEEGQPKPLGFVQLYPSFSSVSMKRVWVLNDLYVEEQARKHGVAEMLMNKAKSFAEETDSKGITLCTAIDNIPAQKLYEKLGYSQNTSYFYYHLFF